MYRVRAPEGWRWVMARGRVEPGADGAPQWLRGVVIDATRQMQAEQRLRASEERYRTLFNSLDQGVCVIEVLFDDAGAPYDYRFLEVNPAFVANSGLSNAAGKTIRELVPTLEQHWFDMYGHVALTGEPVRFTHQAQALERWFDVYATRIGQQEAHRIAILFTDVTARRRADEELRRITADLAEADRLKTEFLATLAHELRNPLAPIRSGLQLMRRSGNDPATVQRVQDIMDRQLDHLVHLVDDLLDVARITRGQVELKPAWVDLGQILCGAVEISRPLLDSARHHLDLELPPAPVRLYADATRITQVISNLLNNAARYTPRGGRIVLSAAREGGQARITVADNGVGIARADLPEIFKIFTRAGSADQANGGLGIGLSLVRSFVELHGGSVRADSAGLGLGAVFAVRLPLRPDESMAPPPDHGAPGAGIAAGALRVLVVDDNRDAAETLAALLDVMGHAAPIANDGQQALRMMHSFRPQVVLLDIGMPGMSGYEVAQAIRRDHEWDDVRLVALTGWGGGMDRERSAGAGFDEHLTKPATIEAIEAVLARAAAHAAEADPAPAAG
jgi:PAS domain S-box-containing protein